MNTLTGKKKLHHRIAHHAKHWFIPHAGNDHRPHALRPRALKTYAYVIITAKVASAAFLFIAFPNEAKYAAYTANTIVSFTNESRQKNGVSTLQANSLLNEAATRKAKDMLSRNYFAHTTPDGKRFWTWIDATGYNYTLAGENLAVDFTSPESAHEALMASPTHRENILNKRYKEIGVAVVTGKMGGVETTVLVEMYGTQAPKKTTTAKVVAAKPKPTTSKPTNTPAKPVAKPAPTKPQVQAGQTPKPKGSVTQQSLDRLTLTTGGTADVWAEFKNTGEQTWKAGTVTLVTEPSGRASSFTDASWSSTSTVSTLGEDVSPQEVVRVEFKISATTVATEAPESFALTDASGTIPGTTLTLALAVATPTAVATSEPTPTQTDLTKPDTAVPTPEPTPQTIRGTYTSLVSLVAGFGNRFFLAILFFLVLALLINIFVKVRIQHAHVIGQSIAVIALAATALLLKSHFLENIASAVRVLGV
ncbi:MAG: CAP domain-containing protein [Patescibacteria group bacterium]